MNKFVTYSLVSLSALLLGCAVGPDYEKPATETPANWVSEDAAIDAQATIEHAWWQNFNDPVLSNIIDQALAGNYDLKIAAARIAEARAARSSASADLLPTGDARASATREANRLPVPVAFPGISNPFDIFETGFDASWELDLFGGHKRAEEAATYEVQSSQASLADARVSLLAEVARTYVDIRKFQKQLQITESLVAADAHTVDITKQRVDAGTAPGLDMTQAEAQLEQVRADLPNERSQLAQAEFSLDVLLGTQPGTARALIGAPTPIPATDKKLVLAAPAVVIDNRPDIRMAERKLAAATARQGVATAKFYPDISLSGFVGLLNVDAAKLTSEASQSWMMGSSVVWPILSYGQLEAGQESADAQQQEALLTYQKTIIAALSDVEKSVTAYTHQQEYRAQFAKAVAKNRHAADISRQRYKEGLTSFIEVLDAERTLDNSETQMAQADAQTTQNLIAVYKSLGGGWQQTSTP